MKKIMSFIISLFFLTLFSNSAFAAGDSENVKKLSSFKKTGTAAGEVIPQNTKFAENVKANIISKFNLSKHIVFIEMKQKGYIHSSWNHAYRRRY